MTLRVSDLSFFPRNRALHLLGPAHFDLALVLARRGSKDLAASKQGVQGVELTMATSFW